MAGIGRRSDGGGRATRSVGQHAVVVNVARAGPCSAGRTGSCGAGCPAIRRARRNGRRTGKARSACACSFVGHAAAARAVLRAGRSCGRRRRWRRPRRTARCQPLRVRTPGHAVAERLDRLDRIAEPERAAEPLEMARHARDQRVGAALGEPDAAVAARACGSARRWRWSSSDCRRPAGCGSDSAWRSFSLRTKRETIE